jgi:hypothetical protein
MIAVYSITHSTYQKNFDAKVKSLHNSYTTDIHINKEQFGVLSVKFIITASDLVKIHKLYTFQANPSYRITFLDPETDFEYNIHCTSPFQQNRLGLKDVISYFEFNLTADIIGLGAFPTYKTGDASFWTHWSERWEVGPVANQPALQAHPYYANKFDVSVLKNYSVTYNNTFIDESSQIEDTGDGKLNYYRRSSYSTHLIKYDLTSMKSRDLLSIRLENCFCFNNDGYFRLEYVFSETSSEKVVVDLYWWRMTEQMVIRSSWYDGALGSPQIQYTEQRSYDGLNRKLSFGLDHNKKNSSVNISIPDFEVISFTSTTSPSEEDMWNCASVNYSKSPLYLNFGFISASNLQVKAEHGSLTILPDNDHKVIIP